MSEWCGYSQELKDWMKSHCEDRGFMLLMEEIRSRLDVARSAAEQKGDTDFEKGKVDALKKILALPQDITGEHPEERSPRKDNDGQAE